MLSARSPVIVGIGQVANNDDDVRCHPVELIERAVRAALADAGAVPAERIGAVYAAPLSVYSDDNAAELIAARFGLPPGPRVESRYSGAGPQRLLRAACDAIGAGDIDAALVVGGVAEASVRRAAARGEAPPAPPTSVWSQGSGSGLEERERVRSGPFHLAAEGRAGAAMPVSYFALVESVLAASAGRDPTAQRAWLGRMMSRFTEVAATRPGLAWFPEVRSPAELAEVSDANRLVAEPYVKLMTSFPTVDLGAAVLVTSEELAERAGVPEAARVRPWALAAVKEAHPPSGRRHMERSEALGAAVRRVLDSVGLGPDDLATFDLYSCFPAAAQIGAQAFGIDVDDPRGLTVTGGLPYFGGPGASYSLHGVACTVERCRSRPGSVGAVVGLGGLINDFSVGLYSSEPPGRLLLSDDCEDVTARLEREGVAITDRREGTATVEAMTVLHERGKGAVAAPAIARFADGTRIGARAASATAARDLAGTTLVGREVRISIRDGAAVYEA